MVNAMSHFSTLSNLLLDIVNLPAELDWPKLVWPKLVWLMSLRHLVSGCQILSYLSPVSVWLMRLIQTIILGWPHFDRIPSHTAEYNKSLSLIQKNTLVPEFVGHVAVLILLFKVRRLLFLVKHIRFLLNTDVGPLFFPYPQRQCCPIPVVNRRTVL